ncbi:hypothetical protein [Alishewanella sp. SMS8]|uniref:hypothetical protein n=1 Tax=Alishewanella sp. SMS8 TaxID=2994676 RepID=UPI0027423002|nr:hypothetical protein [Alishewanella sp. SMS8]MDP5460937.1 hypothetical protein [Alishewanella sp. SMS8]
MNIPKVDTWFFEKLEFSYPDVLSIKLVEGVKSGEPEMVLSDTDNPIGPYFPVNVVKQSQCLRIIFNEVISFHVIDESYSSPKEKLDIVKEIGPVRKCNNLDYKKYVQSDSIVEQTGPQEFSGYYIWTEDQTLFVLATLDPEVLISDEKPDTTLERSKTYFSK